MKDNLRIRSCAEGMASPLEFGPQFGSVIGFAVISDPRLAIRAGHGHPSAIAQIDDGEARIDQEARWKLLHTLAVRTAVFHGSCHAVRDGAQRIVRVSGGYPCNAAHAAYQPSCA